MTNGRLIIWGMCLLLTWEFVRMIPWTILRLLGMWGGC